MKKLLATTAVLAAMVLAQAGMPAAAETISVSGSVDAVNFGPLTSGIGTLNINNQSVGTGIFNLNTVTINSESFLAAPGVLSTNTLNVDQNVGGSHVLVLDITAFGLAGTAGVQNFLSSFSVTGQSTSGWNAREQTYINGGLLADTGIFAAVADSAFSTNSATIGALYNAEVIYTIFSNGIGQFNGGIDIATVGIVTPIPASLPFFLAGIAGLYGVAKRKRNNERKI
jgi:hypothetical protein